MTFLDRHQPDLAPLRDFGSGGGSPPGAPSDEVIIAEQLESLRSWARDNDNDARADRRRFWVFKIPALVGTAATSALEAFGYGKAVIVLGVVSAMCIAVDALRPGGMLHNVHRRATNEIRLLQHKVKSEWDSTRLTYPDPTTPERVKAVTKMLADIQEEKARITQYITAAEASLGEDGQAPGRADYRQRHR